MQPHSGYSQDSASNAIYNCPYNMVVLLSTDFSEFSVPLEFVLEPPMISIGRLFFSLESPNMSVLCAVLSKTI